MFLHVTQVEYLYDYRLRLKFNNGAVGIVDLEAELYGDIFEPLRDKKQFKKVFVTSRTIEWPNGADFAPEFLFERAQLSAKPTIFFPQIYLEPSTQKPKQRSEAKPQLTLSH